MVVYICFDMELFPWLLDVVTMVTGDDDDGVDMENEDVDPNAGRFVRYQFTPQFLKLRTVGAT